MSLFSDIQFWARSMKFRAEILTDMVKDRCDMAFEVIDDTANDIGLTLRDFSEDIRDNLRIYTYDMPVIGTVVEKGTALWEDTKNVITTAKNPINAVGTGAAAAISTVLPNSLAGIMTKAYILTKSGGKQRLTESELEKGDHIFVLRPGYTHHGIYIGDGKVIHYAPKDPGVSEFTNAVVHETTLNGFKKFSSILDDITGEISVYKMSKSQSFLRYAPDEVVKRARSRMGEREYDLITNNCEHFARWCRCGDKY